MSGGGRSSHYFDARQVLLDPEGARLAGHLGYRALAPSAPLAVGGPSSSADAFVCAITASAWTDSVRWNGFFVRGAASRYGFQNWIDGPFIEEGTPVSVVDDTLMTGATLVGAIERARAAGGVVVSALVLIDREEGGRQAVEDALDGAPLTALFTAAEVRGE